MLIVTPHPESMSPLSAASFQTAFGTSRLPQSERPVSSSIVVAHLAVGTGNQFPCSVDHRIVLLLEGRPLIGWSGWELPPYGVAYPNRDEAMKAARGMGANLAAPPSERYWAVLNKAVAACKSLVWSVAGLVA